MPTYSNKMTYKQSIYCCRVALLLEKLKLTHHLGRMLLNYTHLENLLLFKVLCCINK